MKVNELRVDNYVHYFNQDMLDSSGIVQVSLLDIDDYQFFEPLPLTEELLLKCGFQSLLDDPECTGIKTKSGQYVIINNDNVVLEIMFGFLKDGSVLVHLNDCDFENCKYLHQLQNLYFALTGEELDVKL